MADRSELSAEITPEQFFQQLLPLGFEQQAQSGATVPQDFTMLYRLTGDGGGEWLVTIKEGKLTSQRGSGEAVLTFTVSTDDFQDAVLGRNGAALALLLPQSRPGRPDNSGRAKALRGTVAQELSREAAEPFRLEMTFNGAEQPRTVLKMKMQDFIDMNVGKLNGQEAFMTGRMRIEGDMAFLMQIAALTV